MPNTDDQYIENRLAQKRPSERKNNRLKLPHEWTSQSAATAFACTFYCTIAFRSRIRHNFSHQKSVVVVNHLRLVHWRFGWWNFNFFAIRMMPIGVDIWYRQQSNYKVFIDNFISFFLLTRVSYFCLTSFWCVSIEFICTVLCVFECSMWESECVLRLLLSR